MSSNHPAIAQTIIRKFNAWLVLADSIKETTYTKNSNHYKFIATTDRINFDEANYLIVRSLLLVSAGENQSEVLNVAINTGRFKNIVKKDQLISVTEKMVDSIANDYPDFKFNCKDNVGMVVISVRFKSIKVMDESDAKTICSIIKKLSDPDTIKSFYDVKVELNTPKDIILYGQDIDVVAQTLQVALLDQFGINLEKKENGDYVAVKTDAVAKALPNYTHQMPHLVRQFLGKSKSDGGNGRYDIDRYDVFCLNGLYIVLNYSRNDQCFKLTKTAYDFWFK